MIILDGVIWNADYQKSVREANMRSGVRFGLKKYRDGRRRQSEGVMS